MDIFRRRRRRPYLLPAIVVLVVAAGGASWYYLVGNSSGEAVAAAHSDTAAAETPTQAPSSSARPAEAQLTATPAAESTPVVTAPATPPTAAPAPVVTEPTPAIPPVVTPAAPSAAPATTTAAVRTPTTMPNFDPGTVMADAKRLMDAGDLVAARQALNPAITSGMLPENEQKLAMQLQAEINKAMVFSARRLPNDEWMEAYTLKSGDMLQKIAPKYSITPKLVQRVNNITDARKIRAGQTLKMIKGPFHAIVTKHAFTMDIYLGAPGGEGSMYVCTLPVGLGMDNSTPAGTWHVEVGKKLVNPKYYDPHGGGVIEPDDPKNPLGEFWIGIVGVEGEAVGKTSYGIHGTIDPDSIGKMASQGCIRMHSEDIALVYDLLVEGKSTVIVKP